jgi:hypothetical protein
MVDNRMPRIFLDARALCAPSDKIAALKMRVEQDSVGYVTTKAAYGSALWWFLASPGVVAEGDAPEPEFLKIGFDRVLWHKWGSVDCAGRVVGGGEKAILPVYWTGSVGDGNLIKWNARDQKKCVKLSIRDTDSGDGLYVTVNDDVAPAEVCVHLERKNGESVSTVAQVVTAVNQRAFDLLQARMCVESRDDACVIPCELELWGMHESCAPSAKPPHFFTTCQEGAPGTGRCSIQPGRVSEMGSLVTKHVHHMNSIKWVGGIPVEGEVFCRYADYGLSLHYVAALCETVVLWLTYDGSKCPCDEIGCGSYRELVSQAVHSCPLIAEHVSVWDIDDV